MDRVIDLQQVVEREVADYVRKSANATLYCLADKTRQIYATIAVPHTPDVRALVVVMARIQANQVIILTDITDKPLVDALIQAGIPRTQIILAYAGEIMGASV